MKTLGIIGSGHLGQQIAYYAITDKHYETVIFFDDFNPLTEINGFKIIGQSTMVEKCYNENLIDEILIGIGYNHMDIRKSLFDLYFKRIPFGNLLHSNSWIDDSVNIGYGNIIFPGCTFEHHVHIGNNNLFNINCSISHNGTIGSHCFFSPRIALGGFVNIGECVNLGISTTIINNISINDYVRTGAGTIVVKNLPNRGLYIGNPAKFLKS